VDRLNCIDGGSGDDIILGGPAEDRILGGLGNDDLDGGDGDDGISGGPGNDRIFGGSGYDALCGDSSNPKAGRDELHTQADGGEMWAERGLFTPLFVGWSYPELNGPHYCGHPSLFGNNPPNCNPTLTARPAGCP
jgi:hypothetical protein